MKQRRFTFYLIGSIIIFVLFCILSLNTGPIRIDIFHLGSLTSQQINVLLNIRMPRLLFAIALGAVLSVAGAYYQALLHNDLAGPYLLGVSSGASFGAVIALAFGLSYWIWSFAFVFGIGAFLFILLLARLRNESYLSNLSIILGGVVINSVLSAGMLIIMLVKGQDVQQILYWIMGNISYFDLKTGENALLVALVFTCISIFLAHRLNIISLGREEAISTGINYDIEKNLLLTFATIGVAVLVAYTGPIAFIGLIVPHILKLILGNDLRFIMPLAFFTGASVMIAADILARIILFPMDLPAGAVTALIGGPFFFLVLIKGKRWT